MRADHARAATCALDVEVSWGDGEVLSSEHLRGPCEYRLQTAPLANAQHGFVVQQEWLGQASLCLARIDSDVVQLTFFSGATHALQVGEQTCLHVGPLVFRIGAVEPREKLPAQPWTARQHAWTAASLALHGLALGCMLLMPPRASSLSLDTMSEDTRYLRYLNTPVAVEETPLPWTPNDGKPADDEGAKAPGEEGQAGKPDSAKTYRRMAVQGHDDRRLPSRQSAVSEARTAGILGVLSRASLGPAFSFGADTPLGYDPKNALGALFGSEIGDNSGFHGLGMHGTGRSGGGDASEAIGIGLLDTGTGARRGLGAHGMGSPRRDGHVPTLRSGEADVRGSLSKEVIRRAIHLHLNEVRFCYERELAHAPDLAGRISVNFMIAPSGVVQVASIKESTLPSKSVADCVAQAVRRFTFPAPDGGGYVQVSYPFSFSAH